MEEMAIMNNQRTLITLKGLLNTQCGTGRGRNASVDYDKRLLTEFNKLDKTDLPSDKLGELETILIGLKDPNMDDMNKARDICLELEEVMENNKGEESERAEDQQGEVAEALEKLKEYFEQGKVIVKKRSGQSVLVDVKERYWIPLPKTKTCAICQTQEAKNWIEEKQYLGNRGQILKEINIGAKSKEKRPVNKIIYYCSIRCVEKALDEEDDKLWMKGDCVDCKQHLAIINDDCQNLDHKREGCMMAIKTPECLKEEKKNE